MRVVWRSQYSDQITSGEIQARWSADGTRILSYYIDFLHDGLAAHKQLSAPDIFSLQAKVDAQIETWDRRYTAHLLRLNKQNGKERADAATAEAGEKLAALSTVLRGALQIDHRIDWEAMKDRSPYSVMPFKEPKPTRKPVSCPEYVPPKITFIDRLFGRRRKKEQLASAQYDAAVREWATNENEAEDALAAAISQWEQRKRAHENEQTAKKEAFEAARAEENRQIEEFAENVRRGDRGSVIQLARLVLEKSYYDNIFEIEKNIVVDYDNDNKTLYVEYELPTPEQLPRVKAVKFISATGEMKEIYVSDREHKSNYDSVCFQIALRSLYELFAIDIDENIHRVSFNGLVHTIDPSTGIDIRPCILSVLVDKPEFQKIDLRRVDPRACFRSLKGVCASSLAALAPVAPVMEMDRRDSRFVEGRDVATELPEGANLAAMSWEDFEHLVRQVFEREFQKRGGEVRITQASRDGGVDAVAFDPDPIRGGKTIIQAKRYTRPVGVSAVRDLYGTLLNEGAARGILVTTSDYGPDAHKFASDKPIALLSGAHLLHLLREQGIPARIDIAEARRLLGALPPEGY